MSWCDGNDSTLGFEEYDDTYVRTYVVQLLKNKEKYEKIPDRHEDYGIFCAFASHLRRPDEKYWKMSVDGQVLPGQGLSRLIYTRVGMEGSLTAVLDGFTRRLSVKG